MLLTGSGNLTIKTLRRVTTFKDGPSSAQIPASCSLQRALSAPAGQRKGTLSRWSDRRAFQSGLEAHGKENS